MRLHQVHERIGMMKIRIQPQGKVLWPEHQWNALGMNVAEPRVRWQGDDRERAHLLFTKMSGLP